MGKADMIRQLIRGLDLDFFRPDRARPEWDQTVAAEICRLNEKTYSELEQLCYLSEEPRDLAA